MLWALLGAGVASARARLRALTADLGRALAVLLLLGVAGIFAVIFVYHLLARYWGELAAAGALALAFLVLALLVYALWPRPPRSPGAADVAAPAGLAALIGAGSGPAAGFTAGLGLGRGIKTRHLVLLAGALAFLVGTSRPRR